MLLISVQLFPCSAIPSHSLRSSLCDHLSLLLVGMTGFALQSSDFRAFSNSLFTGFTSFESRNKFDSVASSVGIEVVWFSGRKGSGSNAGFSGACLTCLFLRGLPLFLFTGGSGAGSRVMGLASKLSRGCSIGFKSQSRLLRFFVNCLFVCSGAGIGSSNESRPKKRSSSKSCSSAFASKKASNKADPTGSNLDSSRRNAIGSFCLSKVG